MENNTPQGEHVKLEFDLSSDENGSSDDEIPNFYEIDNKSMNN